MHWINDGLMTLYFFVYWFRNKKRNYRWGILSKLSNVITPAIEALADFGMPSLIYLSINHDIKLINGWAIPSAADIAFTL
ncbi:MAG: Na+/H+ antiporter NhaA [Francisella endosymbiont of Hyalomma scupense]